MSAVRFAVSGFTCEAVKQIAQSVLTRKRLPPPMRSVRRKA